MVTRKDTSRFADAGRAVEHRGVEEAAHAAVERDPQRARRRPRSRASPAGPATATRNSAPGESVSRLIFITPPKKKRSMPLTSIPSRRAASACPSSCSTIEPKNGSAAATAAR